MFGSQTKYSEDELCEAIKDVHIIGVRSKTKLTKRVLDAASKLTAIGCFCIGTDQVRGGWREGKLVNLSPWVRETGFASVRE